MDRFVKKWQEWAGPRKITIEIERTMERNTKLTASGTTSRGSWPRSRCWCRPSSTTRSGSSGPRAQYPFQHAKVFADVFKKPHGISFRHFKTTENGTVYTEFRNKIYSGELGPTNGLKEASTRMNQDIDWGGGENPFKGLKLPVGPR
jgi:hypothetical protein